MSTSNPILPDVDAAFDTLRTTGNLVKLTGGPEHYEWSNSHLQGVALYDHYY